MYDWPLLEDWMLRRHELAGGAFATTRSVTFSPLPFVAGALYILDIAVGYTIVALDPTSVTIPQLLTRLVETQPTKLIFTPQMARLLGQYPHLENFELPKVEALNVGGEVCRFEFLTPLTRLFTGNPRVLHGLSSSESVQHVQYFFALNDAPDSGQIPIGHIRPGASVQLEPLDGDPTRFELTVGGTVALGYFGNEELTHASFTHDAEGNRRWRTGDIVSVGEDGLLRHEGRIDDVVKISGHRVSTIDVEQSVLTLDGVKMAVVLVGGDSVRSWLEAHVELEKGSSLTAADARRLLREVLPPYMVPTTLIRHEILPLTLRGKVDKEALRGATGLRW
jgi:acyl-coenzyme A synthetase/AMP-(fatty) acid ligase